MSETSNAGVRPRTESDVALSQKNPGPDSCEVCSDRDAAGLDARTNQHVCRPCARLRADGGLDFEGLAVLERQADALERLADEMEYQNAVLAELAHAVHQVAVNADEHAYPDEKRSRVPSYRGLHGRIDDQRFTREEGYR
ncbi:hypothetical protein [Salinigranum halophilum]|uniref:hypothetical protein n=1 Tax=Salinigranum halophilum TaxID=2565931 RepID=UPI00115CFAC6|nr:hypothetical protein [Salinigranum halophilum]